MLDLIDEPVINHDMSDQAVFRFAPSPNGALHLGHAYSALLNHALAQEMGGRFLVRIEDIDTTRCTPALEAAMLGDLVWLGLLWETPLMRQSERFDFYRQALDALRARDLIYPSFMTRGDIKRAVKDDPTWPCDPDGAPHYPGDERKWSTAKQQVSLEAAPSYAWRLDMERALNEFEVEGAAEWGDVVLGRKETPTSYHLSVVLDDAAQGVTHVVRGRDLEASTAIHILLQKLLDLPTPRYFHHRLILDDKGERLSKSVKSTALKVLREKGKNVADILHLIQWDKAEIESIAQGF